MLGNCTNWDRDLDRDGTYQPSEADPPDPKPAFVHRRFQNLWGARYIDDAVLRRLDNGSDGTEDGRWYYLTDAQFSVRAVLDGTGKLTDRIRYSAYGVARHGWRGDTDGDGATTLADRSILLGKRGLSIGDAGYSPDCDLDRSGAIDSTDANLWAADGFKAALPAGWLADMNVLTSPGGHASPVGYCGYLFNAPTQLYTVRLRTYDPGLGRWLERDPLGYRDGSNLHSYVRASPIRFVDFLGAAATSPPGYDNQLDAWERLGGDPAKFPLYCQYAAEGSLIADIADAVDYVACIGQCLQDDPGKLATAMAAAGYDFAKETLDLFLDVPSLFLFVKLDPETGLPTLDEGELLERLPGYVKGLDKKHSTKAAQRICDATGSIEEAIKRWADDGGHNNAHLRELVRKRDRNKDQAIKIIEGYKKRKKTYDAIGAGFKITGKANAALTAAEVTGKVIQKIAEECEGQCSNKCPVAN